MRHIIYFRFLLYYLQQARRASHIPGFAHMPLRAAVAFYRFLATAFALMTAYRH